jgi:MFS family permease
VTSGVDEPTDTTGFRSPRARFFALFPSIMLPMGLAVVDQTIVASALPAIAGSLGEVERISWVVISYLVANTIAAPVYGYLGDVFGRRRLMFAALTLFIVASALCAMATSIPLLAGARALQGLGGGGLMTLSQALVGQVVPARERAYYQGYLATVATVSSAVGPVIGGFLTESFGWRWIFLINVPLGLAAILLVLRLPARPGTRHADWQFDTPGLFFFRMPWGLPRRSSGSPWWRSSCSCARSAARQRRSCLSILFASRRSGAPMRSPSVTAPR